MLNNVIYIGGVARSGTSWVGQLINSCPSVRFRFQPLFAYEFKNTLSEESSLKDIENFYNDLYNSSSEFLNQSDKVKAGIYPDFSKENETTLAFKENRYQSFIEPMLRKHKETKFVGVIRNPNATLYSWTQNEKEFPKDADILKEWRFGNCKNQGNEDYFGYYKWKEVANLYLDLKDKFPDRVYIFHYDKFLDNVFDNVKELYRFLNLDFTIQTQNFIQKASSNNQDSYYSVYKGSKNKDLWKDEFPKYITDEINADLSKTRLETFLY
jgi:hypothetical protein